MAGRMVVYSGRLVPVLLLAGRFARGMAVSLGFWGGLCDLRVSGQKTMAQKLSAILVAFFGAGRRNRGLVLDGAAFARPAQQPVGYAIQLTAGDMGNHYWPFCRASVFWAWHEYAKLF